MKRYKKLYALLGVLVFVCAVTFAVSQYEEKKELIKNSDEIILELAKEEVLSLSWEYDDTKLAFHKDEEWLYDEDEAFPVNGEKVEGMLELFEELGAAFTIEEVEDFGQYGLDKPSCTISFATAEEAYEIKLGDYSTMDSQRYLSLGDGNVYLVKNDPLDTFEVTLDDMMEHDEFPVFKDVTEIAFAGKETYEIVYEEESTNTYCKEDVYFAQTKNSIKPLDTDKVEDYLDTISYLDLTDYVTYAATEEELSDCGFDDPELTVTIKHMAEEENEEAFVLYIARDPKDVEQIPADEIEVNAYARVGESQIIYKLTEEQYEELEAVTYNDLRHSEIFTADFDEITQIEATLEGEIYTLTSEGDAGKRVFYYGEEEIETDAFYAALKALTADSFTEEMPTGKEEICLTISIENENFSEVTVALYRYDGSFCIAMVDEEPVCLVERSLVVDLIESINAIVLS